MDGVQIFNCSSITRTTSLLGHNWHI